MRKFILIFGAFAVILARGASGAAFASTSDSDHDGMRDGWEKVVGLKVGVDDSRRDPDHDGLKNVQEFKLDVRLPARGAGSDFDPRDKDSDNDSVQDGDEDSDHDEISNEDESADHTGLLNPDSDKDCVEDGDEDADGDGLSDGFELGAVNANADSDHDGVPNKMEDSDGDGVNDPAEFNPHDADSDDDSLEDSVEDEDGDLVDNDGEEENEEADEPDDVDEVAAACGTIASFDPVSGLLVVDLVSGGQVQGQVTDNTEIRFEDTEEGGDCQDNSGEGSGDGSQALLVAGAQVSDLEFDEDSTSSPQELEEVELLCPAGSGGADE
ncbi:MAG TPA: hypothetical protein VF660_07265 [Actinomycetota bacterium]